MERINKKLCKIISVGAKGLALGVAVIGIIMVISACSSEVKIVYNDIPCTNPDHGVDCNPDDHVQPHDCDENCGHDYDEYMVQCPSVNACYTVTLGALTQVQTDIGADCTAENCTNTAKCIDDAARAFTKSAFDGIIEVRRKIHDVTLIASTEGDGNSGYKFVTVRGTGKSITPCTTPNIRAAAQQAALAAVVHSN